MTNILTRCHSASSLFSAVFDSRKVTKEIFADLEKEFTEVIFYSKLPEARRGDPGVPRVPTPTPGAGTP